MRRSRVGIDHQSCQGLSSLPLAANPRGQEIRDGRELGGGAGFDEGKKGIGGRSGD